MCSIRCLSVVRGLTRAQACSRSRSESRVARTSGTRTSKAPRLTDPGRRKKLLARLPVSVAFLPPKATFSLVRAASHSHGDVSLVFWEKEPLFFELAGDAALYPSLYLLWRLPAAVPVLLVHAPVLEYIANGADLMLQGRRA